MPRLRPFAPDDVPTVAALRTRMFPRNRRAGEALEAYVRLVFFENPWADPDLPAWVAEEGGRITGFLGVIPRPFTVGGGALRGAVLSQFMVAPGASALTASSLLKRAMAGPQDFLYADVPNARARRAWERAGGSTALTYGFGWTRTLRPVRSAAAGLGQAPAARAARFAAGPLFRIADAVAARATVRAAPADAPASFDVREIPALQRRTFGARALVPAYTPASLDWLLARARERWDGEQVRALRVAGADGGTDGWFVYLDGGGGTAQVLQVAAVPERRADVLRHLFADAHARGAMAVRGRADPLLLPELSAAGCRWHREGEGILVHAGDPSLLASLLRGDAVFSGLDGEWWLDF